MWNYLLFPKYELSNWSILFKLKTHSLCFSVYIHLDMSLCIFSFITPYSALILETLSIWNIYFSTSASELIRGTCFVL